MSYARLGSASLNVIRYSTSITSSLNSAQTLVTKRHTPTKVQQPGLSITVQSRSEANHRALQKYLRSHQIALIGSGDIQPLRFQYVAARLDYLVFVPSFQAGAVRFEHAPTMNIQFLLVKDLINVPTNVSSSSDPWEGVYSGEIEDDSTKWTPPSVIPGLDLPSGSYTGFPGLGAPGFIQPDQRGNGGQYLPGLGG